MSCKILEHKGRIAFAVYWGNDRKWIGTDLPYTDHKAQAQARRVAASVTAEMVEGTFDDDRFLHWFPGAQYSHELRRRREAARPTMTLESYARDWLKRMTPPLVRPSLARSYRTHLNCICDVEIDLDGTRIRAGAIPVQQISAKHLVAIRAALLASGTKGRRSVKSVKNMVGATLRRMLRDALSIDGLLVADPYVAIRGTWPRVVTPAPDPFDQTERDALLGWFLTSAPQHHAAVATLFLTGMRPSELAGLRWGDIDLGRSLVTIERSRIKTQVEATKTQSSRRTIPVVATVRDLIAGLQPLRPDPDEYVFRGKGGRPINHANLQARDWRRALQKLQIRPRKLYATRATFISLTLSNGAPAKGVAEYCGTSLAMLQRNYSRYMGDPNSILGAIAMPAPATERIVAVAGVPSA